jgi:hypothetical protein
MTDLRLAAVAHHERRHRTRGAGSAACHSPSCIFLHRMPHVVTGQSDDNRTNDISDFLVALSHLSSLVPKNEMQYLLG